jgi:hypothetical protein
MKQKYLGGCQCGKVQFEVELELSGVVSCNCSRCQRIGSLMAFAPAQDFKLLSGDEALTEYLFNKHIIHHMFCSNCGIESFARGKNPADGADMVAVNVRCLDDIDIESLKVKKFDGRSY